jgi:hypothetical protein
LLELKKADKVGITSLLENATNSATDIAEMGHDWQLSRQNNECKLNSKRDNGSLSKN